MHRLPLSILTALCSLAWARSTWAARDTAIVYKLLAPQNTRTVLLDQRGDVLMLPASTMKLFTAWAAFIEGVRTDAYLAEMLQNSVNAMAEATVAKLGGVARVGDVLERDGVRLDATNFHQVDGSGLSKANRASCNAEIGLLEHIQDGPDYYRFRQLLAQPGLAGKDDHATLKDRLLPFKGKIFAKTGTLRNIIALSGYADTASGTLLFCLISHNFSGTRDSERAYVDGLLTQRLNSLR